MRSRITSVLPSVLCVTFGAGLCHAQLNGIAASTGFQAAGSNVLYSAVFQNGVIGGSRYSTVTTGDFSTFQAYPNGVSSWFATASGNDLFRAGPRR